MQVDHCAPTYFVMGDGGNEEGPSTKYDKKDAVRRNSKSSTAAYANTLSCLPQCNTCSFAHLARPPAQQQR